MLRLVLTVWLALDFAVSLGAASDWARDMFAESSHDFGTVARDSKAEYKFVFANKYVEDVHVAAVRASCGCTSVSVEPPLVKTYEEGAVIARINSDSFLGRQGATITVSFDKPYRAEVQLHVKVFVRSDVVVEPSAVLLGNVERGTAATGKAAITFHGRADWRIVKVESANPHLLAEAVETARGSGHVTYELRARLTKNAPPGYVRDQLIVTSNDGHANQIPVLVEGQVVLPVSISPAELFFGVVPLGKSVTKQMVVRGNRPFRIISAAAECECLKVGLPVDAAPKAVHVVPVTFTAGGGPGKVTKPIHIQTSLDNDSPEVVAYAAVVGRE